MNNKTIAGTPNIQAIKYLAMMVLPKGLKDHVDHVTCAFEPLPKDHGITDIFANSFKLSRRHDAILKNYSIVFRTPAHGGRLSLGHHPAVRAGAAG